MSKKFILVTLLTIISVLTFGLTFSFAANNSVTSGNNNALNNAYGNSIKIYKPINRNRNLIPIFIKLSPTKNKLYPNPKAYIEATTTLINKIILKKSFFMIYPSVYWFTK